MPTDLTDCKKQYVDRLVAGNNRQVQSLKEISDSVFKLAPELANGPLAREFTEVTDLINRNTQALINVKSCEELEELAQDTTVIDRTQAILKKAHFMISALSGRDDSPKLAA